MTEYPGISIITPVLNAESCIEVALKSVADQTYRNIEHLIIDGGSTDNTLDIVRKYHRQYEHIKVFSEEDSGIYDAMNKGIKLAKGDWLYFLGSDDRFVNDDVLLNLLDYFNSDLDIFYGNVIFAISGRVHDGEFSKEKLLKRNICHQSIFCRKSVFDKTGYFDTKYKVLADWHFNMKWINNKKLRHRYIGQNIAYYNEKGYSFNNRDLVFFEHWQKNVRRYFPFITRLRHKFNKNKTYKKIKKLLRNL
jgi:glycosyltransferase involved in cell wall biosynthesis